MGKNLHERHGIMYFEIMSSILGKVTLQAMLEASLDLFKLFCLGFKKDKNFLAGAKQQQTFNQLYNFL